jgi:uncharacterized coiled-coil protein SlyX
MATASINIQKASSHAFAHNDRSDKVTYLIDDPKENECNRSASEAKSLLDQYVDEAKQYRRENGLRAMKSDIVKSVEAVVNLNAGHTLKDVERLAERIEKEFGFRAVQIAVHRDEGHVTEDGRKEKNYHAHIVMCNLKPDGTTIQRTMKPKDMTRLQDITADELMMKRGQKGSKAVRLDHRQHKAVLRDREELEKEIKELQKENAELRYAFRDAQKRISSLEGIDAEQKKELHRLNTEINKTADNGDKSRKIAELEAKIERLEAKPEPVGIDVPDKEQINKIGERLQRVANYTADQIIDVSSIERKGVLGTKKEIDVPTLRDNITMVLNQHNELHRETWGIIKKLNEVKEKFLDGAKNVVESSKTALKTIFSLGEGKSLSEEKKGVETPEEAKERIQKFLAEQKAKKQSKGMSR